jgi:hypothetical protein
VRRTAPPAKAFVAQTNLGERDVRTTNFPTFE